MPQISWKRFRTIFFLRPAGEIKPLELLNVLRWKKIAKCGNAAQKFFVMPLLLGGLNLILLRIFLVSSTYINQITSRS